jgi:uncharacterized membrane protein
MFCDDEMMMVCSGIGWIYLIMIVCVNVTTFFWELDGDNQVQVVCCCVDVTTSW